ncbi:MAG: hypothetical protein II454_04140 [Bacteroidales bacterium]|nr:hypothetical protein [Bacteroidales bacterium]
MKNKKGLIILSSVIAVCAVALVISPLVDWPVDKNSASGNISKSSRFSRKTASEGASNMEELIVSDPDYKNGIVTAYMVMQTRAQQFSALVDMSNEVAGDIPEYADVIDEMNKVYVTVNNVCASLVRAGENISATLNGEKRPDLAQNTINASLAYTTLQKQNKLANEFIKVTDEYVKSNEASDRLLFVRDQWVDYQLMTAALEGDEKSTEELEKKGNLLTAEKSVAALGSFNLAEQLSVLEGASISNTMNVDNSLVKAVPSEVISNVFTVVGNVAQTVNNGNSADLNNAHGVNFESALQSNFSSLANTVEGQNFVKAVGWESGMVANQAGNLASQAGTLANQAGNLASQAGGAQTLASQAQTLASQAQTLASQAGGNETLASQAQTLANQAQTLASQAQSLANQPDGAQTLASQAQTLASQAQTLASQIGGAQTLASQAGGAQTLASSAQTLASQAQTLASQFSTLNNMLIISNTSSVVSSFQELSSAIKISMSSADLKNGSPCEQLNSVISQASVGNVASLKIIY